MTADEIKNELLNAITGHDPDSRGQCTRFCVTACRLAAIVRELMATVDTATLREDQATVLYLEARSYLVDALPLLKRCPQDPEDLCDQIEESLRSDGPRWRPMETAPRDGTPVLSLYDGEVLIVRWRPSGPKCLVPWQNGDAHSWIATDALLGWLPLPPAPKEAP